jgi:aspartyl-tRNA(Asn)/glutamyl-tRNA(Gln) amidotransferase subunit A
VPVGIKDVVDVKGMATSAGSRLLEGAVAREDAPLVSRLREAGAVIVGKTNTHEFAYGVVTPPTANPWDLSRIPGGSSGGSAAAVAARMVPAALGTDTAGSIRAPSALCGVTGLRPRRKAVAMKGIIPLAPSLDACGPLARDASDLELLWEAMADPQRTPPSPSSLCIAAPDKPSDVLDCDHDVEEAVEAALEELCGAGARRVEGRFAHLEEWDHPANLILMVEALTIHRERGWYPAHADRYSPGVLESLRYSERIRDEDLVVAHDEVERLKAVWGAVMADVDVLVLPASPIPAPHPPQSAGGSRAERSLTLTLTRPCLPASICDLASVAAPCGFDEDGLPLGVQFIARDEATALAAARRYQDLTEFHTVHPPL